jgi:hypothetical protein
MIRAGKHRRPVSSDLKDLLHSSKCLLEQEQEQERVVLVVVGVVRLRSE